MSKFKPGDRAWIIESKYTVVEVIIKQVLGGFLIIKYLDHNGGYRVKESRLFDSESEAHRIAGH